MTTEKLTDAAVFGPLMRRTRLSQEIPLTRVVDRLDLSRLTVARFEKGDHDMRLSQMIELLDLLGYDLIVQKRNGSRG